MSLKFKPYLCILENKSKTRDRHRACLAEKNGTQRCIIYIRFCALDFSPQFALGDGTKNPRVRVYIQHLKVSTKSDKGTVVNMAHLI